MDTYTHYPLHVDANKAVSASDAAIAEHVEAVNRTHRQIQALETPMPMPPPPVHVNPKRSVQIKKLKDTGNTSFKKGAYAEALKMYDLAIRMATERPHWEPSNLFREELCQLHNNRAQAYMSQQMWPEAMIDADVSIECKRVGNAKGWWRKAKCLQNMGRLEEAVECTNTGLEYESSSQNADKAGLAELTTLVREINAAMQSRPST
ncbi:hypothetical protein K470DRAFT_263289 [Piedraia hortae CBS 480.64]|uniref:TPR-like protein n=1 Tax=Piedraia hortae CBS 480.64 TaxID=1314780 RepID=A0A6A7C3U9_9PEZI|nr:hypothetical protein K470DRAFT_263289 [Piedraia hortae CBS 480.64]